MLACNISQNLDKENKHSITRNLLLTTHLCWTSVSQDDPPREQCGSLRGQSLVNVLMFRLRSLFFITRPPLEALHQQVHKIKGIIRGLA
jgi:hypothetical protein